MGSHLWPFQKWLGIPPVEEDRALASEFIKTCYGELLYETGNTEEQLTWLIAALRRGDPARPLVPRSLHHDREKLETLPSIDTAGKYWTPAAKDAANWVLIWIEQQLALRAASGAIAITDAAYREALEHIAAEMRQRVDSVPPPSRR